VQRPLIGRQQLTLGLEASVCVPELSREEESSVCFGAARINGVGVCGTGAGQDGVIVGCECIALATCQLLSQWLKMYSLIWQVWLRSLWPGYRTANADVEKSEAAAIE
jgi:hypothetical protein